MKEKLLANRLKVTPDEAIEIRERYLASLPAVSRFYEEAIEECRKSGYSYTVCGRRRFLPEILAQGDSDRWKAERQAVNNQIQGTAADAAKIAMINCYNADLESAYGCKMLLQIHDELIFECPAETARMATAEIQDHMTDPFPSKLEVALTASGGIGLNWCAAKEGH
jgi:DNA polymerase-1